VAIRIDRDPATGQSTVTFTIADDGDGSTTSVVGSFNDWTPGIHTLLPNDDGTLSVTVAMAEAADIHFRYLRSGGVWSDDGDADATTPHGSVISSARFAAALPELTDAATEATKPRRRTAKQTP
jgi:hypothetical protein